MKNLNRKLIYFVMVFCVLTIIGVVSKGLLNQSRQGDIIYNEAVETEIKDQTVTETDDQLSESVKGPDATLNIVDSQSEDNSDILSQLNAYNDYISKKIKENNEKELQELRSKNVTFAIFGTDERAAENSRSDIIMIAKYIPAQSKIIIVSVPRDTRVAIPTKNMDKINHAYAFGGPALLERTLEELFDTTIDYYVKISFENFKELIDTIGGVKVVAEKDFFYTDYIDIAKGEQILDGQNALDYVRFRYDSDGDYGRIKRQQEVIQSLVKSNKDHEPENVINLLNEFYVKIKTDLALAEIVNYYKLIDTSETLVFETHMLKNTGKTIDKIWYGIYDPKDLENLKLILNAD